MIQKQQQSLYWILFKYCTNNKKDLMFNFIPASNIVLLFYFNTWMQVGFIKKQHFEQKVIFIKYYIWIIFSNIIKAKAQ